jgi:nucleoside 2-deoxyribosyltransferase
VKAEFLKGGKMVSKNTCFIICAIGEADSKEREWADFVRSNIIKPVVTECGYEKPARSDDPNIGLLMVNIIERMFEADLVVADLTYYNPNVFFELGIRHCAQKPVIHLIKEGEKVPFDIVENKAIFLDRDFEKVISSQKEIKQRIEAIQKTPEQFFSQVQQYIQLKQLKLFEKSQMGKDKLTAMVLTQVAQSINLQSELISSLHTELVEKPKLKLVPLPLYRRPSGTLLTGFSQQELEKAPPSKPSQKDEQKQ